MIKNESPCYWYAKVGIRSDICIALRLIAINEFYRRNGIVLSNLTEDDYKRFNIKKYSADIF